MRDKKAEMNGEKKVAEEYKSAFSQKHNLSPTKQFVLDGGLNDMGVTSRKHNYWKLFGFMRYQIKFQTNGSTLPPLGP